MSEVVLNDTMCYFCGADLNIHWRYLSGSRCHCCQTSASTITYEDRFWCHPCYVRFCKKKFEATKVDTGPKGWTKMTVPLDQTSIDPPPEPQPRQREFYFTPRKHSGHRRNPR